MSRISLRLCPHASASSGVGVSLHRGWPSTWVQGSRPPCTSRAAHTRVADCGVHGHSRSEAVGGPLGTRARLPRFVQDALRPVPVRVLRQVVKELRLREAAPRADARGQVQQNKRPGSFRKPGLWVSEREGRAPRRFPFPVSAWARCGQAANSHPSQCRRRHRRTHAGRAGRFLACGGRCACGLSRCSLD
jgi:hypothetical protein